MEPASQWRLIMDGAYEDDGVDLNKSPHEDVLGGSLTAPASAHFLALDLFDVFPLGKIFVI